MNNRADIEVIGRDGERVAVVEVKRAPNSDRDGIARWRRNMIVHGLVPTAPYFVFVTAERVYVWKQGNGEVSEASGADAVGPTETVIGPFLKAAKLSAADISEEALELSTVAWLGELARDPEADTPEWLAAIGFVEAVLGADVRTQVAA